MGGFKRRLSSTSIVGTTRKQPRSPDDNPVEEIVDEEWVERAGPSTLGQSTSGRRYLEAPAESVVAKRHIVRFRGSSQQRQTTTPSSADFARDELKSIDSLDRQVTFEEEQTGGRYSLEVEDSQGRRTNDGDDDDDDDSGGSEDENKSLNEPGRGGRGSRDCCEVSMEHHCHHHHHHSTSSSSSRPPVIVVEPHLDESTHCEHCQFLSGWFCCIPFLIFTIVSLIIVYLCFRQRINKMLDDWQHRSAPIDDLDYWSTEPMELEQPTGTTPVTTEVDGWMPFRGLG